MFPNKLIGLILLLGNGRWTQTKNSRISFRSFVFLLALFPYGSQVMPKVMAQRVMQRLPVIDLDDNGPDDDGPDDDGPDDEELNGEEMWAQGAFPRMNRQMLRESLFGALGGSENAFQQMKRQSIRRELDRIEQICGLSTEQKEKIEDAIEIDIQHIHAKIETLMSEFDSKMTMEQFQQIQQNVYSYASQMNANHDGSNEIWRKVLRAMLTDEQTDKLSQDKLVVEGNRLRTRRLQILLQFQRKLGLTEKQRVSVLDWLNTQEVLDQPFWKWCEKLLAAKEVGDLNERQRKVLVSVPKQEMGDLGKIPILNQIKGIMVVPIERLGR